MKARAQVASLVIATSVAVAVGLYISVGWVMFPRLTEPSSCGFGDTPTAGWGAHPGFVVGIGAHRPAHG
jgi:hypothetical protein